MRTEIQVFTSEKFGQLRTAEIDGAIWFCGIDVAKALGYTNPRDAYKRHCKSKGVVKRYTPTDGGRQEMVYLDEGNMYRLISHSKLPSAERFESWVFDEVLPSIRRTGSYIGKSENPNVALVTITPEMAEEMLKKNIGNRKINQANVNRIAADMVTGNYKLNSRKSEPYRNGGMIMKKFSVLTVAFLMLAMVNPTHVQAAQHDMGTLMKDVNFDGAIDGKDATLVLSEYAHTSVGEQSTFTPTQKFVADTDFDGAITSIDASCILTTYAIASTDWKYPIKTVTFGVLSTGYQSFFLENALEYAHDNGISESQVVANVTVWTPSDYCYATYAIEKPSE